MTEIGLPWERQPGESSVAYARFQIYRDLGSSRTLRETARISGLSLDRLKQLSTTWRWRVRAAAWELRCLREAQHQEAVAFEECQERLRRETERHAQSLPRTTADARVRGAHL